MDLKETQFLSEVALKNSLLEPLIIGQHRFPGIWRMIMPADLALLRFPEERKATCSNCPKSCYESYRRDYRCCTYHPRVPNFLLGLATLTTQGDQAVDKILAQGMLLPEGMLASPQQWLDSLNDESQGHYGRSEKVLCPLLDTSSGLCNIHDYRNAVCSTFFCYTDHGESGDLFWAQLQTLGSQVELTLAQWALRMAGFDFDLYLSRLNNLAPNIDQLSAAGGWRSEILQDLWGAWFGREKELLRKCVDIIIRHKDSLWTIAQQEMIQEAKDFERALEAWIPPELRDEEPASMEHDPQLNPSITWQACLDAYSALWVWPEGSWLTLNSALMIQHNPRQSRQDLYEQNKDHILTFHAEGEGIAWRLAVGAEEIRLLHMFKDGKMLTTQVLEEFNLDQRPYIKSFISEMLCQGILQSVSC